MTDNDIIKALECCIKYEKCEKCPIYGKCEFSYDRDYVGIPDILSLSFDLINRQQARIKELEEGIKNV